MHRANMFDKSGYMPTAGSEHVAQEVGDELVVYVGDKGATFSLDAKATVIYRMCDGKTKLEEAVARLREDFKLDSETAEAFLLSTLREFWAQGFVAVGTPKAAQEFDRRKFLAFAGKLAAAAPVVSMLLLPSPASAASTCPTCANCTECGEPCNNVPPNCGNPQFGGFFTDICNFEMRVQCANGGAGTVGAVCVSEFTGGTFLCRTVVTSRHGTNCYTARDNVINALGGCPAANNELYYCCCCPGGGTVNCC